MLDPYTQTKLDELQSLISQRNELDERIRALLDGGLPPAPHKAKAAGKARTPAKSTGRQPCPECGSLRRHFKTCTYSSNPAPAAPKETKKSQPLTEEQFDQVKQRKEDGDANSLELSREMKVAIREVNIALFSSDFDAYLKRRKKGDVI